MHRTSSADSNLEFEIMAARRRKCESDIIVENLYCRPGQKISSALLCSIQRAGGGGGGRGGGGVSDLCSVFFFGLPFSSVGVDFVTGTYHHFLSI